MNLFARGELIVLEIHPVFLRPLKIPTNKNLPFKTAKHSKARAFSARQDKTPQQGDACCGVLTKYCGKRSDLEHINP